MDQISISWSVAQCRAWNANGFFEGMHLWNMLAAMKDGPALSLTFQINHHKDNETTHRLRRTSEQQVSTYVEAVNVLLKFYATDSNIATATLNMASLKKALIETFGTMSWWPTIDGRTLWKCVLRRTDQESVCCWFTSQHLKCGRNVLGSWTRRALLGDCTVRRHAIETNRTNARLCDGPASETPFSEMSSIDSHRGCHSRTKVYAL